LGILSGRMATTAQPHNYILAYMVGLPLRLAHSGFITIKPKPGILFMRHPPALYHLHPRFTGVHLGHRLWLRCVPT